MVSASLHVGGGLMGRAPWAFKLISESSKLILESSFLNPLFEDSGGERVGRSHVDVYSFLKNKASHTLRHLHLHFKRLLCIWRNACLLYTSPSPRD